jgi:hypothetical protein
LGDGSGLAGDEKAGASQINSAEGQDGILGLSITHNSGASLIGY